MRKLAQYMIFAVLLGLCIAAANPNFVDAQIRQRLARARVNLSALGAAIESYRVDYDKYPGDGTIYCWNQPSYPYDYYWYPPDTLTTPVGYISSEMRMDPFREDTVSPPNMIWRYRQLRYIYVDMDWGTAGTKPTPSSYYPFLKSWYGSWKISSAGPDKTFGPFYPSSEYPGSSYPQLQIPYDPTNGLSSTGDMILSQRKPPLAP